MKTFPPNRIDARLLYLAVGSAAVLVYLGALANRFAMDDIPLIVQNPLVRNPGGLWRAFGAAYWPADLGGTMYRPLPIMAWALDRMVDGAPWYHLVNLFWHAAVCVALAALVRRLADDRAALVAGLLFAVHPVHVEAVANVVGRAEAMAALCVILATYAALVRRSVWWSALAWAVGLLCKENAAVLPALVVWGWWMGFGRPSRRRILGFVASWVVIGAAYGLVRWHVLLPYARFQVVGMAFLGQSPVAIRLTAVAALADLARLLVFPLTLRADYSPDERTIVTSPADPRFLIGLACLAIWGVLLVMAWRRGRRLEAFGLGWIGIAFLPVANLVFPAGFYLAERTLYLPSAGLCLAAASWLGRLPAGKRLVPVAAIVLLGGLRTALRVPVWRDDTSVTLSVLDDSPRSYVGPKRMIAQYLDVHQPGKAVEAARRAAAINANDPSIFSTGAVAAFAAGQPLAADSMLAALERVCYRCLGYYRQEAATARAHGYVAAADSLEARAKALGAAP